MVRPQRNRKQVTTYEPNDWTSKSNSNAKSSNSNAKSKSFNDSTSVAKSKPKSTKENYVILLMEALVKLDRAYISLKPGSRLSNEMINKLPSKINIKACMQDEMMPDGVFWDETKFTDALTFCINGGYIKVMEGLYTIIKPKLDRATKKQASQLFGFRPYDDDDILSSNVDESTGKMNPPSQYCVIPGTVKYSNMDPRYLARISPYAKMPTEALVEDDRAVTPQGNELLPWNLAKITKMMIGQLGLSYEAFFELLKEGDDDGVIGSCSSSFRKFVMRMSEFPETGIVPSNNGKPFDDVTKAFSTATFLQPLVLKLKKLLDDMDEGDKKTAMLSCKFC